MDLRQLEHFVAVAEDLSFTRAAERLHMGQSPLSASIKRLEARLGVALLRRTSRRVELTDAGAVLLVDAREVLAAATASADRVRRTAAGAAGLVTVTHTATISYELLPSLRAAVQRELLGVTLAARETRCRDVVAAVRRGEADLGLCCCPDGAVDLQRVALRREPLVLLVADDHHLAGGPPVDLQQIADERFQIFPRDLAPALHDHLVTVLQRGGASPRFVVEHVETRSRERIASGELVALAPRSLGVVHVPGTVMVELRDPVPSVTVEALMRVNAVRPAVARVVALAQRPPPFSAPSAGGVRATVR